MFNIKSCKKFISHKEIFYMKNAIIIGASSGIGKELAKVLSNNGYNVGIAARRKELLEDLKKELKTNTFIKQIDVSEFEEAKKCLTSF